MKKTKNYIDSELAKRKITRYKFWAIKDEGGITIATSEDDKSQSFTEHLDDLIEQNVDAEVQIKFGVNEQSARQNNPIFIKINDSIEWVEPEDEEVKINGIPHKVDRNGNVNINLTTDQSKSDPVEIINNNSMDFDIQLKGLKNEFQLRDEKREIEMNNKLYEQTLKFKEMLLAERESRVTEREQQISQIESELETKEQDLQGNVKGVLKHIPSALGGILKDYLAIDSPIKSLGNVDEENEIATPRKPQTKVQFTINNEEDEQDEFEDYDAAEENVDEIIIENEEENK